MRRPRTLLCSVDVDDASDGVLSFAHDLAVRLDAALQVVHVVDIPSSPHPAVVTDALREASAAVRERLERVTGGTREKAIIRVGPTADEILTAARQCDADLLVMGTRTRGAVRRALLGSTAEAVLSRAPLPVLILPSHAAPWRSVRTAVVAHDLQDSAGLALLATLEPLELWVHVLHSVARRSGEEREAKAKLGSEVARTFGPAASRVTTKVVEGSLVEAVRELVADTKADLLVVGRSRRSVLGRRFFGTNGIALVREAEVPVLMVPEDDDSR